MQSLNYLCPIPRADKYGPELPHPLVSGASARSVVLDAISRQAELKLHAKPMADQTFVSAPRDAGVIGPLETELIQRSEKL